MDYDQRTDTADWGHIRYIVQDITDDNHWIAAVEVEYFDIPTTGPDGTGDNLPSEFLFKFVTAGHKYKVSYIHMNKDWSNYVNESDDHIDNCVEVTAIGGLGSIDVHMNRDGFVFLTPQPKLYLNCLTLDLPDVLKNAQAGWDVHAEVGSRWGSNAYSKDARFVFTDDFITGLDAFYSDDFTLSGKSEIYFNVNYTVKYENVEYFQWVVNNDDYWFADYGSISETAAHLPVIKIKSTTNYSGMKFVLEPIASHVKEVMKDWDDIRVDSADPWYEVCEIYEGNTLKGTGQVKVRGNWTTSYNKKSLRIKFDEKQTMLGLHDNGKYKNWVLLAAYKDASFLRDAVGLKLYKEMYPGYASDAKLVEVEVNGTNLGVYILAEQQEAKRLDLTEPEKKATNTDIGYLIEFDSYYQTEKENERFEIDYTLGDDNNKLYDYVGNEVQDIQKGYTIKSDITNKTQHDFIADYMQKVWEICYNAAYKNKYYKFTSDYSLEEYDPDPECSDVNEKCKKCIEEIIDLGSLADFYVFNELICDPDLYLTSFFMNVDFKEGHKRRLTFNAPWDFDSTMGNKKFCTPDHFTGSSAPDEMYAGLGQTDVNGEGGRTHANPWMVVFIKCAWFQEIVKGSWGDKNKDELFTTISNYIDDNSKDEYQPVFDFTRNLWGDPSGNSELCEASSVAAATSQKASADYLINWLNQRRSGMSFIFDLTPGNPQP